MNLYSVLFALTLALPAHADMARAPIKFDTNTRSDYEFIRPTPGEDGDEIFRSLCTASPPGCDKGHSSAGIPIACAISPEYENIKGSFQMQFKRVPQPAFEKDSIKVDRIYLGGETTSSNKLNIKSKGKIIAWKWNSDIEDELRDHLGTVDKRDGAVKTRMKAFEYRMINDLKHEEYHVEKHFIPYYERLEKLLNSVERSEWNLNEWSVAPGDDIPKAEINKSLSEYIGAKVTEIEKWRDETVQNFHNQQNSYSDSARNCACYGDLSSCKKMDTFWTYE